MIKLHKHQNETNPLLLEQIYDQCNLGIMLIHPNGEFIIWNQWMENASGLSRDDVLGKTLDQVFHKLDNPRLTIAIEDTHSYQLSSILSPRLHGNIFPLNVKGTRGRRSTPMGQIVALSPLTMAAGGVCCLIQVTDVTAALLREDKLRKQARSLSLVVAERVKELTGLYALTDVLMRSDLTLAKGLSTAINVFPPAWSYPDITCARITLEDFQFTTENFKETTWRLASDIVIKSEIIGTVEVFYLKETPERDEGPFRLEERLLINEMSANIGTYIERKQSEDTLRKSRESFRLIIERSPVPMIITDSDGNINLFNRKFVSLFGWTIDDVRTTDEWWLAAYPDSAYRESVASSWFDAVAEATATGIETAPQEWRLTCKKGDVREVVFQMVQVTEDEAVIVLHDITERKKLEEQLRRSQKMEAVGQLTGGIAHDFNNLLNIVMGKAEILGIKIEGNKNAERDIEAIIGAVQRGASLTERLLAFSRQQVLSPQPTAVNDLVLDLDDMLRRTLGETVELHTHLGTSPCQALIDPHQFENALLNLAINAQHAMPKGGRLTIETADSTQDEIFASRHEDLTPGDYVVVTVSDTGTGMSPVVLEKAFDPFFTTKEVGEGSGLGLSMVYGFANQSNGCVTLQSEEGHGTIVKLYLPRSPMGVSEKDPEEETPQVTQGSGRILLVEDDEDVREIPTSILRDEGYEVFEAGDGEEAIKLLKEHQPFDLLFTDVVLPGGMNGVEIAEETKRLQPSIKVLYTTGYAEDAFVSAGKQVSDDKLLSKPYRRAELLEKVQTALESEDD